MKCGAEQRQGNAWVFAQVILLVCRELVAQKLPHLIADVLL